MLDAHTEMFDDFQKIHDKYATDPNKYQNEYNEKGQEVMHVIQKWENILCSKTEGGKYGKFSSNLSEKYWAEIRILFPKIDYIGLS